MTFLIRASYDNTFEKAGYSNLSKNRLHIITSKYGARTDVHGYYVCPKVDLKNNYFIPMKKDWSYNLLQHKFSKSSICIVLPQTLQTTVLHVSKSLL